MIGNNACGARSLVYGKTVDHVLEVRALLADGTEVTFGPLDADGLATKLRAPGGEGQIYRTVKALVEAHADEIRARYPRIMRRVGGYNLDAFIGERPWNLAKLIVGSEGTLGVIPRLTLRLHPLPVHVHTLRVFFEGLGAAADAAYALMASGLPAARLELLDELGLGAINRYLQRDYPEKPALFVEFHSSTREALEAESRMALELVREAGAIAVDAARTSEERTAQWEARHQLYWALVAQYPGRSFMITDTAVPISRMPELVRHSQRLLREMGLGGSIVGHVGDGNFHTLVATGEHDYPKAEAFAARLVEKALELGGTCTGEHGVGLRKKKYLAREHGAALEWMRQLKRLFDPQGLLNPGKVV